MDLCRGKVELYCRKVELCCGKECVVASMGTVDIINIHRDINNLDSQWEIADINKEE